MSVEDACRELSYLVTKYISDEKLRDALVLRIHDSTALSLPVRGILHEIEQKGTPLEECDGEIVKRLIFHFG